MPAEAYYAIAAFIAFLGILIPFFFWMDRKISLKVDQSVSEKQWQAISEINKCLAMLQAGNARMDERSESLLREITSLRRDLNLDSRMENIEQHIMGGPRG